MSQIIGPVVALKGQEGGGGGGARPHMRQLNGVERGQGLAVILEVQRDLTEEFVYFQVVGFRLDFPPSTTYDGSGYFSNFSIKIGAIRCWQNSARQ